MSAAGDAKRWPGSLAIAFRRTPSRARGSPRASKSIGGAGSTITLRRMAVTLSARKGFFPLTHSYRTQPSEKMSARASTFRPFACSGDM